MESNYREILDYNSSCELRTKKEIITRGVLEVHRIYILFMIASLSSCQLKNEIVENNFSKKYQEVENWLVNAYGVDKENAILIRSFLDPLIKNKKYHPIIDEFIQNSKGIKIDFMTQKAHSKLSPYDGVLKAPQWHHVLFESPQIRILRSFVKPGECDPFHLHQWNRIMIVVRGAKFETEHVDGTIEIEDCPIGVYEMESENTPAAYTNIGNTEFEALVFEVKQ